MSASPGAGAIAPIASPSALPGLGTLVGSLVSECPATASQTPQEIQEVLSLGWPKRLESCEHGVGFRRRVLGRARTGVSLYRLDEVGGSAIVQQENALPQPPQGCRPEFVWSRDALGDAVSQLRAHSMQE